MQSLNRFRRSGSFARFMVDGAAPDPRAVSFCRSLMERRFHSIETSSSEESSLGWITPADPTGEHFAIEDMDQQLGFWLRLRIDKKTLPSKWLAIHRAAAERAAGRPLSTREKRELKTDLAQKLLPRVLPTVNLVDALYFPERSLVLLFSTSRSVREGFMKLFQQTFGTRLLEADPYVAALHCRLPREHIAYLDQVAAVPWPTSARLAPSDPPSRRVAPAAEPGVVEADTLELQTERDPEHTMGRNTDRNIGRHLAVEEES